MRSKILKRGMDLVGAACGLVLLAPVMLVVALLIRLTMGSPVLFRQERPGLYGRPFTMYKFRTMLDIRNERGELLPDELRLTPVGRFLRRTSLDELPELFNVLKGDMSLVGPRPLLSKYLPYYTEREHLRHSVKPGITGWAQVNGRNYLNWDERLAMDIWYVENWSLLLDVKVIILTFCQVFRRHGVIVNPCSYMADLDEERRSLKR